MKRDYKNLLYRCLIMLVGLVIAHFGVTIYLLADLGADPFNVFVQGAFRSLQSLTDSAFLTHGRTHIAISLLIIFILLAVDRTYIKIGTILCMICGGPIIDFFTMLFSPVFAISHPVWADILAGIIACAILAFGMTIVIKSDAGTGPNDLVAVVISDKIHRSFSIVRIAVDVAFVAIGFILGGSFGIGTIICAFLVGPVAGFFPSVQRKIYKRIIKMPGSKV